MGLQYRKGINLGPVRVNLSGSGVGASIGALGTRVGKSATGRKYVSTNLGMGFRHVATLPGRKNLFPEGVIDLSGGEEFWFDVSGEESAQADITAAVAEVERHGGSDPIIPVYLFSGAEGSIGVSVLAGATYRDVGSIQPTTKALKQFVERLGQGRSVGRCSALVFDEDGRLGLKLNIGTRFDDGAR